MCHCGPTSIVFVSAEVLIQAVSYVARRCKRTNAPRTRTHSGRTRLSTVDENAVACAEIERTCWRRLRRRWIRAAGPGNGARARGSLEFLGRWNDKRRLKRAMAVKLMPIKLRILEMGHGNHGPRRPRPARRRARAEWRVGRHFAINQWTESRGQGEFSWSASPDDVSYQRHGFVGMQSDQRQNIRFADFEGVVGDFGAGLQMAVYRVAAERRPRPELDAEAPRHRLAGARGAHQGGAALRRARPEAPAQGAIAGLTPEPHLDPQYLLLPGGRE